MLSWFPIIMPEMYDRAAEGDSVKKWDFKSNIPNIVIIDILQNDSWLVAKPENAQFKARFGASAPDELFITNAYKYFILHIRSRYPQASIICTLGSMDATKDTVWVNYIKKAVATAHDPKIYTHFFPYKNTPGHPKRREQQDMANSLIQFIDSHLQW